MNTVITKVCEVCHRLFHPDPRVGERQRECKNLRCQQVRKRRAQQRWLARNPDYFQGRYANLQDWLQAHPGYLKNYRHRQSQSRGPAGAGRRATADIQDELSSSQNSLLETAHKMHDIQDEITAKITTERGYLQDLLALIYKTSQVQSMQALQPP
jgi:hypothetical protein